MQRAKLTYDNFADQLVIEIPEFIHLYEDHKNYNDEVLPHVLLGDFVRFLYADISRSTIDPTHIRNQNMLVRSLDLMERAITSDDPALENLIGVSFVENLLPENGDEQAAYAFTVIRRLLGPKLRESLEQEM
ncbi:MAG: hypothetical protein ABI670_05065 [Chloroflexota bacterium]